MLTNQQIEQLFVIFNETLPTRNQLFSTKAVGDVITPAVFKDIYDKHTLPLAYREFAKQFNAELTKPHFKFAAVTPKSMQPTAPEAFTITADFVTSDDSVPTYQWYKRADGNGNAVLIPGATSVTFNKATSATGDSGYYSCTAKLSNGAEISTDECHVTVV